MDSLPLHSQTLWLWNGQVSEFGMESPKQMYQISQTTLRSRGKTSDDGLLQRKVRAYGNFAEYVPLALLFILALELMPSPIWLLWLLGSALTVGRIAHAWGLIKTYGPSPGRAIGFFLTWFVYIIGAGACIYYGVAGIL
jgi:uncharacterized membrane protein YecN with MAPEG domain